MDMSDVISIEQYNRMAERLTELEYELAESVKVVRCRECKWHLNGHLCKQLSQYGSIETPGFGERRDP